MALIHENAHILFIFPYISHIEAVCLLLQKPSVAITSINPRAYKGTREEVDATDREVLRGFFIRNCRFQ